MAETLGLSIMTLGHAETEHGEMKVSLMIVRLRAFSL
jgi:hypothetical protein